MAELTFERLADAVAGGAVALRSIMRQQPAGLGEAMGAIAP